MIMANGIIYEGSFKNDKFDCKNGKLYLPSMIIYVGQFSQGLTHPIGMLLFQSGDIYYGQIKDFTKHGIGKLINYNGSYYEGYWDEDKMTSKKCKLYDQETGNLYIGPIEDGKKEGKGMLFEEGQLFEVTFHNNKKQGDAVVYRPNGEVLKCEYRNDSMEGPFKVVRTMSQQ